MSRHVTDDILMAYEAGSLAEGWSLAVATHLALCPEARGRAAIARDLGGVMLESIEPSPLAPAAFDRLMARIEAEGVKPETAAAPVDVAPQAAIVIPEPLRSYLGGDVDAIRWKRLGLGAHHLPIRTADRSTSVRLLRIPAGVPVPEHGHRGMEMTVVLAGTLCDGDEVFRRGEIEIADEDVEHQPLAGPGEDCICLAVTDAPLRFKSLIVRLAQPFLKI